MGKSRGRLCSRNSNPEPEGYSYVNLSMKKTVRKDRPTTRATRRASPHISGKSPSQESPDIRKLTVVCLCNS
ncbi:hypothetical protein NOCA2120055 [metagenome]|uniref:Uncharacterized protein n=1 Tax=metagenome TaxID=256318 RepID=A0A2P2BZZ8_9ZZZZ